jgi:uncharacterized protein YjbI with pentapeptide repeats
MVRHPPPPTAPIPHHTLVDAAISNTTVINQTIKDSKIAQCSIINSTISDSTFVDCKVVNCTITNCKFSSCVFANCSLVNEIKPEGIPEEGEGKLNGENLNHITAKEAFEKAATEEKSPKSTTRPKVPENISTT